MVTIKTFISQPNSSSYVAFVFIWVLWKLILRKVVYFGGDPRKHQKGSRKWDWRGKTANTGHIHELIISMGNWDLVPGVPSERQCWIIFELFHEEERKLIFIYSYPLLIKSHPEALIPKHFQLALDSGWANFHGQKTPVGREMQELVRDIHETCQRVSYGVGWGHRQGAIVSSTISHSSYLFSLYSYLVIMIRNELHKNQSTHWQPNTIYIWRLIHYLRSQLCIMVTIKTFISQPNSSSYVGFVFIWVLWKLILRKVVYFGGDPRKHQKGTRKWDWRGKTKNQENNKEPENLVVTVYLL
jgi:hypothetical protein